MLALPGCPAYLTTVGPWVSELDIWKARSAVSTAAVQTSIQQAIG